jgi:NAD+ kinase
MKIGICPSSKKDLPKDFVLCFISYLQKNNIPVFIDIESKQEYNLPIIEEKTDIDIFITFGGDGTLLHFVSKYIDREKAVFTAVNFGSLGFMADIQMEEFEGYLKDLILKKWTVENRIMLDAISPSNKKYFAVNDIVLHRGEIRNMVKLEVSIDNEYFNTFWSDGLIISTPNGSTAYSLAASGPILYPTLHAFVITPICPHTLMARPFVVPSSSKIEIKSISQKEPVTVTMDGLTSFQLEKEQLTHIELSNKTFKLISFTEKDTTFYSTLRKKLSWKGSH